MLNHSNCHQIFIVFVCTVQFAWNESNNFLFIFYLFKTYIAIAQFNSFAFILPFFFDIISRLDNHLILCHNYKKDEFRCEICSQGFSYRQSLLRHRVIQHGEIRKFPCENCSKVSTNDLSPFIYIPIVLCLFSSFWISSTNDKCKCSNFAIFRTRIQR